MQQKKWRFHPHYQQIPPWHLEVLHILFFFTNQKHHSHVICYEKEVQNSSIRGCSHFHPLNCKFKLTQDFCYIQNNIKQQYKQHNQRCKHTKWKKIISSEESILCYRVTTPFDQGNRTSIGKQEKMSQAAGRDRMKLNMVDKLPEGGLSGKNNSWEATECVELPTIQCSTICHQLKHLEDIFRT